MQPYLKFFIFALSLSGLGCVSHYSPDGELALAFDEGRNLFYSNYLHCTDNMDAAYKKFPVVMEQAFVIKARIDYETIYPPTKTIVKPDDVFGPFLPSVEKVKKPSYTERTFRRYCGVENVDINHNKRLLEVQRCMENRCMQSFEDDGWWPSDRKVQGGGKSLGPIPMFDMDNYPIEKLALCAGCSISEAHLLSESDKASDFIARKLEGTTGSGSLSGYPEAISVLKDCESNSMCTDKWVPKRMFDETETSYFNPAAYDRIQLNSKTNKVEVATCWNLSCSNSTVDKGYFGDPHLREIIFCDPNNDETFYITDTPVLASDWLQSDDLPWRD